MSPARIGRISRRSPPRCDWRMVVAPSANQGWLSLGRLLERARHRTGQRQARCRGGDDYLCYCRRVRVIGCLAAPCALSCISIDNGPTDTEDVAYLGTVASLSWSKTTKSTS